MTARTQHSFLVRFSLIGAFTAVSAPVFAEFDRLERPVYGFVQGGSFEQDLQQDFRSGIGPDSGFSAQTFAFDIDDQGTAYAIGLGYQLLPWLAAEFSYSDFDVLKLRAAATLPDVQIASEIETSALSLEAVAFWDFAPSWHASFRLGAARWDAELDSAVLLPRELANQSVLDDNDLSAKFGIGIAYDLTEQLALALLVDQFDVDSDELGVDEPVRTLSARLTWRF